MSVPDFFVPAVENFIVGPEGECPAGGPHEWVTEGPADNPYLRRAYVRCDNCGVEGLRTDPC